MTLYRKPRWKEVPGYPNYLVSSTGLVWSVPRVRSNGPGKRTYFQPGRMLRQSFAGPQYLTGEGYLTVQLFNKQGSKRFSVHRLVMLAFRGLPPPGMEIRHLDDVKTNNHLSNLVYGTHSENTFDRVRNGIHHNTIKTRCKQGHKYTKENTYVAVNGSRKCRQCSNERHRRTYSKKKIGETK